MEYMVYGVSRQTLLILGLLALLGCALGGVSYFRTFSLERELGALRRQLRQLQERQQSAATDPGTAEGQQGGHPPLDVLSTLPAQAPSTASPTSPSAGTVPPHTDVRRAAMRPVLPPVEPSAAPRWQRELRQNWMVWLGGSCVGLAGIFLAKYSMDQGLLGPGARVAAGILTGIALHVAAAFLRRRKGYDPTFAALAGGGSLTLFAAVLAAFHLYDMFAPGFVFLTLALVAMATMVLALWHGAVLAVLGLLGAYAVPLLVGGSPDGAVIVLAYALVIAAAALLLMRWVYRPWLWLGMLGGACMWLLLTLDAPQAGALRGLYIAALGYLMLAVPRADWLLRREAHAPADAPFKDRYLRVRDTADEWVPFSFAVLAALLLLVMARDPLAPLFTPNWLALPVLLLVAADKRHYLALHPALLMVGQLLVWVLTGADGLMRTMPSFDVGPGSMSAFLRPHCLWAAAVYAGLSLANLRSGREPALWAAMAVLAPLAWLTLAWRLTAMEPQTLQWLLWSLLLGAGYGALAARRLWRGEGDICTVWLIIGSHLAFALAVAMHVREASLTLALAVQLISLASLIRRFELPQLGWMLKVVVAVVVVRLSLNPWLWTYPAEVHWSLWTYGGSALCCAVAAWLLRAHPALGQWAQGAALHLFALFCWAETRYTLYDGQVLASRYTFVEAVLNLSMAMALALVYHWRSAFSAHLGWLFRGYAAGLMVFALGNYGLILLGTLLGTSWMRNAVDPTPIWNILLPAFGLPAMWAALVWCLYLPRWREPAAKMALFAAFVFINIEIHHLWQGRICLVCDPQEGELYTYSLVWLALAAAAILGGIRRFGPRVYRAGMVLLVVVVAKLFLVDMAGLQGLWRVASFMGMGLGLLGLAFLHSRWGRGGGPQSDAT